MKRLLFFILVLWAALLFSSPVFAQIKYLGFTALTSGTDSLGARDGADLNDGDIAFVILNNDATYGSEKLYYILDADSATAESVPDIITPDTNAGDKRWILLFKVGMDFATDPDTTVANELSHDTDGANVSGDAIIRTSDGTNQWPVGQKIVGLQFAFVAPQDWSDAARDLWVPWFNETGMTFNITRILCTSTGAAVTVTLNEITSRTNFNVANAIGTIDIDTAGTGGYYKSTLAGSLTHTVIETQSGIGFDFDDTDDPDQGECLVQGWFNADVD